MDYTVTLTPAEDMALSWAALSQQEWIDNAVHNRCRVAMEEIVKTCVDKCLETSTQIPSSKEDMVVLAFAQGWVKTGVQRNQEAEAAAAAQLAAQQTPQE